MSVPYSRSLRPPAPVLHIQLNTSNDEQSTGLLSAFVDTGADATIVPMQYLIEIGAEETAPGGLRGITGERVPIGLYFVDVRIGEATIPGVRVIGLTGEQDVLLGRDVLNRISLLLDGPKQATHLLDDSALQRLRAQR